MTDIFEAIMNAYRRVEARKAAERKVEAAMRVQEKRDRRRYPKKFDG